MNEFMQNLIILKKRILGSSEKHMEEVAWEISLGGCITRNQDQNYRCRLVLSLWPDDSTTKYCMCGQHIDAGQGDSFVAMWLRRSVLVQCNCLQKTFSVIFISLQNAHWLRVRGSDLRWWSLESMLMIDLQGDQGKWISWIFGYMVLKIKWF